MQTVWVIEQGSYSDYRVVGVFSTEADAQYVADFINVSERCDPATIAEWPLNPVVSELRQGCQRYFVLMQKDGTVEKIKRDESAYDLSGSVHVWRRSKAPAPAYRDKKGTKDVLQATVWAKDEAHAIKITNEHRTRMIAIGQW